MNNQGFTLIEFAIALIVIGLLSTTAMTLFKPTQQFQNKLVTQASLVRVSNILVSFAVNNHRLPCPDTNGNGYENCAGSRVTGAVPFKTLMVELGTSVTNSDSEELNMIYGVYRNASADADLSSLIERTGDSVGMDYFKSQDDFIAVIRNAIAQPTSLSYPYITGDGEMSGAEICATNNQGNVAFIVASAGGEDRSGNGNAFDGVNQGLAQNGTGSNCFAAVNRSEDAKYDDGVIATNFNSLLAHIIN
jgi:prepilin-type N-terminal cleavage/methylation domain-containing protein